MTQNLTAIQPFRTPVNPFSRSFAELLNEIGEKVYELYERLPDIEDAAELAIDFIRRFGEQTFLIPARLDGATVVQANIWMYDWVEQEPIQSTPFFQDKVGGLASTGSGGTESLAFNGLEHMNPPTLADDPAGPGTQASAGVFLGDNGVSRIGLLPLRTNAIVPMFRKRFTVDPGPPPQIETRYWFGIGNDVTATCV